MSVWQTQGFFFCASCYFVSGDVYSGKNLKAVLRDDIMEQKEGKVCFTTEK